jgi:DNA helicase II / ATP-dependent DNA helicase PcrA
MTILDGLNPAQREAVAAGPGPVLVLAGPGSGKTRVLTHRVAYLIQEMGVAPWRIMAVTFTNKAAREMNQRVETMLGSRAGGLTMGTFHATCVRILRRESEALGDYDGNFVIFDTDDQRQVIRRALADLDLDEKRFQPSRMLNHISAAKNELVTPDEYAASNYVHEITRRVYRHYQAILVANNAMDFDDLLMNTVLLFERQPAILERYRRRYEHILVDEFQDTNTAQYELLRRLAPDGGNLFAVGDADQSIYKWRGADFRNLNRFRRHYPQAQMILLEQNYRSTQVILDAAKAVIRRNSDRVDKELFTLRKGGSLVGVREAYNEAEEAEMVVSTIERLMLEGVAQGDCAVMYRTNAQSRALEEAFIRTGWNYRLVGATRFYARREIKDLIAYLRLVHNPADAISFNRIVNVPPRGIGKKTLADLLAWASQNGWRPGESVLALVEEPDIQHPFDARAHRVLSLFGRQLREWMALGRLATAGQLLEAIVEAVDYRGYIDDGTDEGSDRWANVMELRNVASEYDEVDLTAFLERVALVSDVDDLEEDPDVVTLLTLHAAKGLEFPVVFIVGLEEGMLPHSRSLDDPEELAEERRLFYVGLTRAKDRVFLSHAFRRTFYGEAGVSNPSRFLAELPEELIEGGSAGQRRTHTVRRASSWQWQPPTSSQAWERTTDLPQPSSRTETDDLLPERPRARQQFQTGQQVHHPKFGDGIVIESKVTGSDEEVVVAFKGEGLKKLVASLARLQVLE